MPLLISPIDGSPMKQIQRFGIELDICPASGGVWLDKGELEKLIALIKEATAEEERIFSSRDKRDNKYEERSYREDEYRKPYYKEHDDYHHKGKYKKKGALHQMMEIFDF